MLCVPASASARALTEAARGGARAALVCSGGYAEAGIAGAAFQRDLAAAAAEAGVALLGPNTSGFLVPARRLHASFVPGAASVPAGPVAVVAASGGVNHALAYLLAEAGLGVSLAVGLGNAVDVSTPDVLRYLADDEPTRAVALHVESVPDGPALVSAVRHLTARKPVAALVVGRSDVPTSRSRTPARWPPRGGSPARRCGRPARCWLTTSSNWPTRWPPCRPSGCRPPRCPRMGWSRRRQARRCCT